MDETMVLRINELARKKREQGLTEEETQEQAHLRAQYIAEFRKGMEQTLSALVIEQPDGTRIPVPKKSTPS